MRAALAAVVLTGCGGLANDQFRGEPLFTLKGSLMGTLASRPQAPNLGTLLGNDRSTLTIAGEVVKISSTGFPAGFQLELFGPPPDAALVHFADGTTGAYGLVVAVDDANLDGAFGLDIDHAKSPDAFFGFGLDAVLLYLSGPTGGDGAVDNPAQARAGYQLANLVCGSTTKVRVISEPYDDFVVTLSSTGRLDASAVLGRCVP